MKHIITAIALLLTTSVGAQKQKTLTILHTNDTHSTVGAFLRRTWLDELPMFINILKGEMKLVGVRPLSQHYFSLYTPEMQELRTRTLPGLLPPFYYEAEQPHTLEEVQESEQRYLEAYLQHPLRTDWRYFWGIMKNVFLRNKRSH